jgi:SAM-dependent methyltransferase
MQNSAFYQALFRDPPHGDLLWDGQYKIPWHEPEFSRRMLAEHLSQDHDMASRNRRAIAEQAAWIHQNACGGQSKRILDIGCGPGLYIKALSDQGHECVGFDFSPASVRYAQLNLGDAAQVSQADIREAEFGQGFELAMMLYGEINVFSPEECLSILKKVRASLAPGGKLLLEFQPFEYVKSLGQGEPSWYKAESGLFSDEPHVCLMDSHWYQDEQVSLQEFVVIEALSGAVLTYSSTTKAWSDGELGGLLSEAGFGEITMPTDWPAHTEFMKLATAVRD